MKEKMNLPMSIFLLELILINACLAFFQLSIFDYVITGNLKTLIFSGKIILYIIPLLLLIYSMITTIRYYKQLEKSRKMIINLLVMISILLAVLFIVGIIKHNDPLKKYIFFIAIYIVPWIPYFMKSKKVREVLNM